MGMHNDYALKAKEGKAKNKEVRGDAFTCEFRSRYYS